MATSSPSMESIIKQQLKSTNLVELVNLKFDRFKAMITELNSVAEYFLDDNGYHLSFAIPKGTDQTFLWKFTVRIECTKSKIGDTDIQSYRILRLSQFLNIYNFIKQHTEALKVFEPDFQDFSFSKIDSTGNECEPCTSTACTSGGGGGDEMTDSKLYDVIQSMSSSAELRSLDETCCICMESKPNLILQCTHNFCEVCMKEWKITSNTCPICRCISEEQDCFVLADKLDYYHIQDEISKSLFQITDGNRKAFVKRKAERANENSEPQASHSSSDDSG